MRKIILLTALLLFQNIGSIYGAGILIVDKNDIGDQKKWWRHEIDYKFVVTEIWPKLLKIANSDLKLKFPAIKLSYEKSKGGNYVLFGMYYPQKKIIEIYPVNIYNTRIGISTEECNLQLYLVISHELLHYIYDKNRIPIELHHSKMYDDQSTIVMVKFLMTRFKSKGTVYAGEKNYLRLKKEEEESKIKKLIK